MNPIMLHDDRRGEAGFDPELLLVLAKAGDGVALGRLLERYRNYMTVLIRIQVGRRLSRKVDAEDLLQEIGLEVHRKISMFRGSTEREFLTWIRRLIGSILANQVRHFLGTKCRDLRLEQARSSTTSIAHPAPWPRAWSLPRAPPASKRSVASKRSS